MQTVLTKTSFFIAACYLPNSQIQKKLYHILKFTDSPFYQWSECVPGERRETTLTGESELFRE